MVDSYLEQNIADCEEMVETYKYLTQMLNHPSLKEMDGVLTERAHHARKLADWRQRLEEYRAQRPVPESPKLAPTIHQELNEFIHTNENARLIWKYVSIDEDLEKLWQLLQDVYDMGAAHENERHYIDY
jgi:hypothetical protein